MAFGRSRGKMYAQEDIGITFEDDEAGVLTRDLIGVDNLLWGNDYPHHDAIWPNSMEVLDRIFTDVPADDVRKMTWDNVVALYGIRLPEPVAVPAKSG